MGPTRGRPNAVGTGFPWNPPLRVKAGIRARPPPCAAKLLPRCSYLHCEHLRARAAACAPWLVHAQPPRTAGAALRVASRSACRPRASMTLYEQLRARAVGRGAKAPEMRAFPPPTLVRRVYQARAQSRCSRERATRRSRTGTAGMRRGRALRGALHATERSCWSRLAAPHACSAVLACCCGTARALRCAARRARKGLVGVRCGSALSATLLAARL